MGWGQLLRVFKQICGLELSGIHGMQIILQTVDADIEMRWLVIGLFYFNVSSCNWKMVSNCDCQPCIHLEVWVMKNLRWNAISELGKVFAYTPLSLHTSDRSMWGWAKAAVSTSSIQSIFFLLRPIKETTSPTLFEISLYCSGEKTSSHI